MPSNVAEKVHEPQRAQPLHVVQHQRRLGGLAWADNRVVCGGVAEDALDVLPDAAEVSTHGLLCHHVPLGSAATRVAYTARSTTNNNNGYMASGLEAGDNDEGSHAPQMEGRCRWIKSTIKLQRLLKCIRKTLGSVLHKPSFYKSSQGASMTAP